MAPTAADTNREKGDFHIKERDFLFGKSSNYLIEEFLGQGTFGKVARCLKLDTKERVAVKIVRKDVAWAGKKEVAMLKYLSQLDQDKYNLVKLTEYFKHKGHVCLAFEMLDLSLYDFMKLRYFRPMRLSEIRVISHQMLVALTGLKSISLAHADIKPDNIMLVNHQLKPLKLKLIDFGLATPVATMRRGAVIQAIGYRAPEVILGLPLSEAIDMWALGCVLAFMYLGQHLYPTQCEYEVMRVIVQMQGQPSDHLLNSGVSARDYFYKDEKCASWRLNTRDEYKRATGSGAKHCSGIFDMFRSLNDIAKTYPGMDATEYEDTQAFLSLLKRMLHVDPEKRISPDEALGHRFMTMKHFPKDTSTNPYATSARLTKTKCQLEPSSVEMKNFVTSSEVVSWTGASITTLDDALSPDEETTSGTNKKTPATAALEDTAAAGNKNRPPAKAGLDDTAIAGTDRKLPSANGPSSAGSNEGTAGFVEVKTRKKWIKRVQHFFSRMFKSSGCCRVETRHA